MCTNCSAAIDWDHSQAEAFGQKLLGTLNEGALSLMISVGHRTGLFDALSELSPSTAAQIAEQAGLNERYVREWLGAMVTAGVIRYDSANQLYQLPAEHASFLTRSAGANNLAALTQYIAELGSVESKVVECFRKGGGVRYEEFPRFHEVMAEDSGQSVLPVLEDQIIRLVPGLTDLLDNGIKVLDVGCGRGKALTLLAKRFPRSKFIGYELSSECVDYGNGEARRQRLSNITFKLQDAAAIADHEQYDLIFTFDAIHDQAQPQLVLNAIYRALKPGGIYLMQDIDAHAEVAENTEHPIGTLLYTISCMHCMTVSLAQGGAGLGAVWGIELAQKMLRAAGFTKTRIERLSHDVQNCYFINSKPNSPTY